MKVLFDECMPQPLRKLLPEFEIRTAQEEGWGRVKNGEVEEIRKAICDLRPGDYVELAL